MLVTGQVGLNDMSGPVGIVTYLGEAGGQGANIGAGLQNVCYVIALIAVNLAIMNLLPCLPWTGAEFSCWWWERCGSSFSGQKLNPKYEAWIHAVGFFPAYSVDGACHLQRHLEVGGLT